MSANISLNDAQLFDNIPANHFLSVSECYGEGNLDNICDIICDNILDSCIKDDPNSQLSISAAIKNNNVKLFGEISTIANVFYEQIVRKVLKDYGYDNKEKGLDYLSANVITILEPIFFSNFAKDSSSNNEILPENSGSFTGYASMEGEVDILMPLSYMIASKICMKIGEYRKSKEIPWLRSDCNCQVCIEYKKEENNIKPIRLQYIIINFGHEKNTNYEDMKKLILEKVAKIIIPVELIDEKSLIKINPLEVITGTQSINDMGKSGKKGNSNSYGGWITAGSTHMNGKDYRKIERAAPLYCRYVAKSLVNNGLCQRVAVNVSYATHQKDPLCININTFNTSKKITEKEISVIVKKNFDFSLKNIISELKLDKAIYTKIAMNGAYGFQDPDFTWEHPKKLEI